MSRRDAAGRRAYVDIAIALVWRDAELLITERRAGSHLAELWEFPGGRLEPGETLEACAEREVYEETAIVCSALRRRRCIEHVYSERSVRLWPIDCSWQCGEGMCLEVSAARWVTVSELERFQFPPANQSLLNELCAIRSRCGTRRIAQ